MKKLRLIELGDLCNSHLVNRAKLVIQVYLTPKPELRTTTTPPGAKRHLILVWLASGSEVRLQSRKLKHSEQTKNQSWGPS